MVNITLNQLIEKLTEIKNQHKTFGDLPIIYSVDDEGNDYHKILNAPGLFKVKNIEERFLIPVHPGENPSAKDFNCVIIN